MQALGYFAKYRSIPGLPEAAVASFTQLFLDSSAASARLSSPLIERFVFRELAQQARFFVLQQVASARACSRFDWVRPPLQQEARNEGFTLSQLVLDSSFLAFLSEVLDFGEPQLALAVPEASLEVMQAIGFQAEWV